MSKDNLSKIMQVCKKIDKDLSKNISHYERNYTFFKNRPVSFATLNSQDTFLYRLYLHVVDHCNLRCSQCDNYSPFAEPRFETLENWTSLLSRFSHLVHPSKLPYIHLSGGEPFLHPDLLEFCRITHEIYPYSKIVIFTNGTLLLKYNKDFYSKLKEYNTSILLSDYPIGIDYDKITEYISSFNVCVSVQRKHLMTQIKFAAHKIPNNDNYSSCSMFAGLLNGKRISVITVQLNANGDFFSCSLPANIMILNKYFNINMEIIEWQDYVNIYKIQDSSLLFDLCNRKIPFCNYCLNRNMLDENCVDDWKETQYQLSEYIVNDSECK